MTQNDHMGHLRLHMTQKFPKCIPKRTENRHSNTHRCMFIAAQITKAKGRNSPNVPQCLVKKNEEARQKRPHIT